MPGLIGRCGGGGGITTPQLETFAAQATSVPAGATRSYFFTHASGQSLLDGTGSSAPPPLANGVYYVLFRADAVSSTNFNAGRGLWLELLLGDGAGGSMDAQQAVYPGAQVNPARISASVAAFMNTSGSVQASVVNQDTVAHTINMIAYCSRIG